MSAVQPVSAAPLVRAPADFVPFPIEAIEQSLAERFESQVRLAPARVAVATRASTLSYAQLNARANGIAAALLATSARRELPVAVFVGHGAMQVAAILAVLKAGRAYVGMDPAHEPEGHRRTLAHCGADVLLCDGAGRASAAQLAGTAIALVDIDTDRTAPREDNPTLARSPDDPAYIYYTSGTTGVPKGVLDNQRNVLHNVMRYTNSLAIAPSDRLSLLQSVAFSGAVSSLFGAVLNGATSLPANLRAEGMAGVAEWLDANGATIYHSVPSLFERLLAGGRKFERLRVIRLEGDLASMRQVELFRQHFGAEVTLVNGLGATETGLSHQFVVRHDTQLAGGIVPVGHACADMRGLIVDAAGAELPPGSIGEVAIRSRFLALGYWRRPELTAARFTGGTADGAERTYRSADLGRYSAEGQLELLGRSDQTFKLHGRWVDLGAMEAALMCVAGVRQAIAVVRESAAGGGELVAYLVAAGAKRPALSTLREALRALPDGPAAPSRFVWLDELPLDANGKVQRHALPEPARVRPEIETPYVSPTGAAEEELARLWSEVLGLEGIGSADDFAELGGNSLQAIEIVTRAGAIFGLEARAQRLLEASTVAQMAQHVEGLRRMGGTEV